MTKFTLKTFPQTQVWGGLITYSPDKFDAMATATSNFITKNTDPKAAIITEFNTLAGLVRLFLSRELVDELTRLPFQPGISLSIFYDGPTVPAGVFDEILAIESFTKDVSTRSFSSLVQAQPAQATEGLR